LSHRPEKLLRRVSKTNIPLEFFFLWAVVFILALAGF
jgi:hypothetical protein